MQACVEGVLRELKVRLPKSKYPIWKYAIEFRVFGVLLQIRLFRRKNDTLSIFLADRNGRKLPEHPAPPFPPGG